MSNLHDLLETLSLFILACSLMKNGCLILYIFVISMSKLSQVVIYTRIVYYLGLSTGNRRDDYSCFA